MKQTARIISTYSADVMGVCSALFELGGMTVMHDASGCNSTYTTHDEPRWFDMDSMVYISGISEIEAIMGDDEKLISDIADAAEVLKPAFIAIAGTPIPTMTGFDFEAVAQVIEQRTGIPCFGFPTTGMNTYIHGASMAFAGIAERLVDDHDSDNSDGGISSQMSLPSLSRSGRDICCVPPDYEMQASDRYRVNIIGLTPLDFSINGQDGSIVQWLMNEGFEVVSKWAMGSSLDEIRRSAEADVNLVVSAAGFEAAKVLYERFGIPYVAGLPIGEDQKYILSSALTERAEQYRAVLKGESDEWPARGVFIFKDVLRDLISGGAIDSDIVVIGEPVTSLALASAIEFETGRITKVLCATEPMDACLRQRDRVTPDEDDIIPELEGASVVIADPLYKPIIPESAEFIPLPSEAFSGRIYRDDIPDLISDAGPILNKL